jgi:TPR repeat protein
MLAQEELGAIYFTGYGALAKDYKKSVFWFQKAIDQNHSMMANIFLARMYEYGWGVDQDSVLASGYYQDIEFSEGNAILKKAIAPEWIKVQSEKMR